MKLVRNIVFQARKREGQPAIAYGGGIATYGMLMHAVAAVVEAIELLRLRPGALVILDVRNPIHHVALMYALALLGKRSASVGATYVTQQTGPRPDLFLTDREDIEAEDLPIRKIEPGWFAFDPMQPVPYDRLLALPGIPDPDAVVRYVYSSGTTGRPKCVALTGRCLELRQANANLNLELRVRGGAVLNMLGFSTIVGSTVPIAAHTSGALLCFASSNPEVLQMLRTFDIAILVVAVVQAQGLIQALGDAPPPPALKGIGVVGAKLPARLLNEIRMRLANYVVGGYGSTEMGSVTSATFSELSRVEGSVGKVLPWVRLELVDDLGHPVPVGQNGVVRVQSDDLGFYVDEQGRPAPTLADGWFYPGDVARMEADGLLVITGRTGEIINRGGVIVAPEVIEEALRVHSAVSDVAVVASPNAAGIDEIWAAIVPAGEAYDPEGIAAFARVRLNERAPDRLFRVTDLPRNENGKLMRNVLREALRGMLEPGT